MQDISALSLTEKNEIASYIMRDNLADVNKMVNTSPVKESFYVKYGKRIFDVILSLIVLIVTIPINLIIAVVTFFDVGSPILFKQSRMGKDMKKFTIYKFRNMTNDTDVNGELLPPSQRVTKWGKFVRKTSLDELLNFVSILNGSMSIIGPRPLHDYYAERMNDHHKKMYRMKPGLECPTPNRCDHKLSWEERLDNYAWYAENCSFALDVKLFFRMFMLVFDSKETKARSEAKHGGFLGYDENGGMIYTSAVPEKYIAEFLENNNFASLEEAIEARTVTKKEEVCQ